MNKKYFIILIQLMIISVYMFSSEYVENQHIEDLQIVQNRKGNCYVLYKTEEGSLRMFTENHFQPDFNSECNFFNEQNIIVDSQFYKTENAGNVAICFTGNCGENDNNLYIFVSGLNYEDYFSRIISINQNINIKYISFTENNEITVFFFNNYDSSLYSLKIDLISNNEVINTIFTGYIINEIVFKEMVNKTNKKIFYGYFITKELNDIFIFSIFENNEYIEFSGRFDNQTFLTFDSFTDSILYQFYLNELKMIKFLENGKLQLISYNLNNEYYDPQTIKYIFAEKDSFVFLIQESDRINTLVFDKNDKSCLINPAKKSSSIDALISEVEFLYLDKSIIFDNSIILIIKNKFDSYSFFKFDEYNWLKIDTENIEQRINPEFSKFSDNNNSFKIVLDRDFIKGTLCYCLKINNMKTIPIIDSDYNTEDYSVIKNSVSINGLFYTILKKDNKITIFSKVN